MRSKYEKELYQEAARITALCTKAGLFARADPTSLRAYQLKLDIARAGAPCGQLSVYYAPSTRTFKHVLNEIRDAAVAHQLRQLLGIPEPHAKEIPAQGVQLYVDGSYIDGRVGYGAVILRDGVVLHTLHGRVYEDVALRQVAGELKAAMEALSWCAANGIHEVQLLYDYEGVEKWATRKWKANKLLTQAYQLYMADCPVNIRWQKVASHSGTRWNDEADRLAKQGALGQ